MNKLPTFYIQSTPPKECFVHHAPYAALKGILTTECLREGKPYNGISLTTDPGRFLCPLPILMFPPTVDGFLEFPAASFQEEHLAIPCLYRTCHEELVTAAKERGHQVFAKDNLPAEYKYLLRFVVKSDIFVGENEWLYLGKEWYIGEDYKLYINRKQYRRFTKSVGTKNVLAMEQHPMLKKVVSVMEDD